MPGPGELEVYHSGSVMREAWLHTNGDCGIVCLINKKGFQMRNKSSQAALGIALAYCLISSAWIFFSDPILKALFSDPDRIIQIQTYKSWAFVGVTAVLLYIILNRSFRRWEQATRRRKEPDADIQERLRLEEQLSKLAETAPGVIHAYRQRPDGTVCFPYANTGIESIYGLKPEDLVHDATPALNLIHPDDANRLKVSIEESARDMSLWRQEFRVRHPRRGEIWVEGCSSPTREPDGGILWQGFLLDITERKQAAEIIANERQLLRTLIDLLPETFYIKDLDGRFLVANEALAKNFGKETPSQILGLSDVDFFPAELATKFRAEELKVFRGEPLIDYEEKGVSPNGRECTYLTTKVPFRDSEGKIRGLVGIGREITERKQLEEQFRQSQKMDAIGQLSGGVAHDFNNILTVIQGNASLLLNAQLKPEEKSECSMQIVRATERAADLTRQLLMFSRKQLMQSVNLNLNDVVGQMTKMLQRILGEDIVLQSNYAPNLPPIHADVGMIEQVLLNLVINARDAMPGGGQLTIGTGTEMVDEKQARQNPDAKTGLHVWLTVTDTGCGISVEILPRMFEPFFTTKEVGKGTGLGLATVYGIVKQHHGWISVASEINKGTTFRIYLPPSAKTGASQKLATSLPQFARGTETILVVEDELPVRSLVNNLLQRCGYTVLQAKSGADALKIWQEHKDKIQLLLTDIVMPDNMTGIELGRQLQNDKPELKIIYTSGYSGEAAGKGLPLVEGTNFLAKPYRPEKLTLILRKNLDRK
jgi:PAS domain S-box-containing protein